MITSLAELLLQDIFYKRDANNKYILNEKKEFITDNINEMLDRMCTLIHQSWVQLTHQHPFLGGGAIHINYIALKQALMKYSRDVFGQRRLLAKLNEVPDYKAHFNSMEIYGMKINSFNPYIHRRAGCFIYWCCMLKPFQFINKDEKIIIPGNEQYIVNCFNEITAYNLLRMMLSSCYIQKYCNFKECKNKKEVSEMDCALCIKIDNDNEFFRDFLYDVHFRSLSRSSLELFMSRFCIVPYCKKGNCPLTHYELQRQNLLFIDEFEDEFTGVTSRFSSASAAHTT